MLRTREELVSQLGRAEGLFKMLIDDSGVYDKKLLTKQINSWLRDEGMDGDDFLKKKNCDRCDSDLPSRIMSWFTKETICLECSGKESEIKSNLRKNGISDAMEGCGFIPKML